jgi:hypothetical protein
MPNPTTLEGQLAAALGITPIHTAGSLNEIAWQAMGIAGVPLSQGPSGNLGLGAGATLIDKVLACGSAVRAGTRIANIVLSVGVAATGTPPTKIFVGILDPTYKCVAVSADLAGSTIWTLATGWVKAPLTSPYDVPSDGVYYAAFLQDGSWGATALSIQSVFLGVTAGNQKTFGQPIFGAYATGPPTSIILNTTYTLAEDVTNRPWLAFAS